MENLPQLPSEAAARTGAELPPPPVRAAIPAPPDRRRRLTLWAIKTAGWLWLLAFTVLGFVRGLTLAGNDSAPVDRAPYLLLGITGAIGLVLALYYRDRGR